jgi:uncharacterized protein DUF3300
MKALLRSWIIGGLALIVVAAPVAATVAVAQDRVQFRQEELDQMLAPIALYPDPLLSQILMASTYPLEVVEAARWSKANPNLKGQDAVRAVDQMNWDPSVKSLTAFPQVLAMMDSKLEWTESLGEAFVGQQEDVMNSVQGLRRKAEAQGNLLSSDQMRVARDGDYITIAPPAPQVVYVPYYDPMVVYGPWWYPAYPPVYWAPPAYYVGPAYRPGFYWGSGIAISATFFFGHTDWRHRRVTVVNNQVNNVTINRTVVNNRTVISNAPARSRVAWQPDPAHRRGAPFRHDVARQRFEQHAAATGVASRSAASAAPSAQQRQAAPRSNAVQEKRDVRRPERRDPPQSRAAPQDNHPNVIQGGQGAQPSAQQRDSARAQAEARKRQATPAPQAAEPRVERREASRPQAQPNVPRPQAESHAQRPAPQRSERQAERREREAPRAQPQSHSPRPAPAAPRPEARNNGGGTSHPAPAASAPRPAASHPPAHSNGNQQRTERGPRGHDG